MVRELTHGLVKQHLLDKKPPFDCPANAFRSKTRYGKNCKNIAKDGSKTHLTNNFLKTVT